MLDLKSFIVENFEWIQIHLQIQIIYRHGGGFNRGWKGNRSGVNIHLDVYVCRNDPENMKASGIVFQNQQTKNNDFNLDFYLE